MQDWNMLWLSRNHKQENLLSNHLLKNIKWTITIIAEALKVQAQDGTRGPWARNTDYDKLTQMQTREEQTLELVIHILCCTAMCAYYD